MSVIRAVTVYAGSSRRAPQELLDLAASLGRGIAARGWTTVYGGSDIGLMGALANAALAAGGRVEGVILDTFSRVAHAGLHDLVTVSDMRSRKAGLAHRGDAFVVLPGGFGTLEELSEILVERELALHAKPLVLVDHQGFWDGLTRLLDTQVAWRLLREEHRRLLELVPDADAALALLDCVAAEPASGVPPLDLTKLDDDEHG